MDATGSYSKMQYAGYAKPYDTFTNVVSISQFSKTTGKMLQAV